MSFKMSPEELTKTKSIQPALLEVASRAEQQCWKQVYDTELEDMIKDQDFAWQRKIRIVVSNISDTSSLDKLGIRRTVYEAIDANIDAINSLRKEKAQAAVFEEEALAMARDMAKVLLDCAKDAHICKGTLAVEDETIGPNTVRTLSEDMHKIEKRCVEKALKLADWGTKMEKTERARARETNSVNVLREQIRCWLRVAELAGVELDPKFEETAMEFGYVE